MLKFKELSLAGKIGVVVFSVSYGVFMTYCVNAIKKESDEIDKLSKLIVDETQRVKDSLY